jgi:hypothetical protein
VDAADTVTGTTQPDPIRVITNASLLVDAPFIPAFAGGTITAIGAEADSLRSTQAKVYDAKGAIPIVRLPAKLMKPAKGRNLV